MADLRRCIGSARFGIEPHDAPVADFPAQPSQKDGLGRMCKAHWNTYTAALARAAKARKAAAEGATLEASVRNDDTTRTNEAEASEPEPKRTGRPAVPVTTRQGDSA
jgi:hypothetical protein